MPKTSDKEPIPDVDNPEWTEDKFKRALRFRDLPPELQVRLKRTSRGPQKEPTKELISLRLSTDVLAVLRAKGQGWQTLIDETLRKQFVR